MPLADMVKNMQGLQAIAINKQAMRDREIEQKKRETGIEALRKYYDSEAVGNPDMGAFYTAVTNVPDAAKNVLDGLGIVDEQRGKDAAQFAIQASRLTENPEQFMQLAANRVAYLQKAGRDPSDTLALIQQYQAGDKKGVLNNLQGVSAALVAAGHMNPKAYEMAYPEAISELDKQKLALQNRELDLRGKQLAASSTQKPGDIERNWAIYQELKKTDPEAAARFGNAARFEPQSGDIELQQKLAEAKTSGKTISEAKANLPKIESANKFVNGYVDAVLKHPGRPWSTGLLSLAPTVRGTKQADFRNKMDQIGGQSFLQAFETLRGGGQITQIEGEKATAAINRMKASTSDEEFNSAAQDFKNVVESALKNARDLASGKSLAPTQEQPPASSKYKIEVMQ